MGSTDRTPPVVVGVGSRRGARRLVVAATATAAFLLPAAGASAQTAVGTQYSGSTVTTGVSTALRDVQYVSFGTGERPVRRDVRRALREAGIPYRIFTTTDGRISRLIASDYAKRSLSSRGPEAVGTAVATRLAKTGDPSGTIFRMLFPRERPEPVTATVLSRGDDLSPERIAFLRGVAVGFGAVPIPTVYAERSDDPRKHADEYRGIPGVGVVENVDTPAGRRRLVALLTGAAGSTPVISAETRSAIIDPADGGAATVPLALVVIVLAGGGFVLLTSLRRRRA
jgi:hypothetical protein